MANLDVQLSHEFGRTDSVCPDVINVPVTLGGSNIWYKHLQYENVVVDAAHSGYHHMFEGYTDWKALVCLSFFPTKPLGAFGGGAIIGPEQVVEHIRETAYPTVAKTPSTFMYPQGIQSIGLMKRLLLAQTWRDHRRWAQTANRIWEILSDRGFRLRWSFETPHILSFIHPARPLATAELREFVQRHGYETGRHYTPLDTPQAEDMWVALPFIYPELCDLLEKY